MTTATKAYRAKPGAQFTDIQAQKYGDFMETLEDDEGRITPGVLVAQSKDMKAPTHDFFEWNNRKAGNGYRLQQARHLLNHIIRVVVTMRGEEPVPAFINLRYQEPEEAEEVQVYVSSERVVASEELRKQVVAKALREAQSWRRRYQQYKELATIFAAIEGTERRLRK